MVLNIEEGNILRQPKLYYYYCHVELLKEHRVRFTAYLDFGELLIFSEFLCLFI
jgi:hypothetical protein